MLTRALRVVTEVRNVVSNACARLYSTETCVRPTTPCAAAPKQDCQQPKLGLLDKIAPLVDNAAPKRSRMPLHFEGDFNNGLFETLLEPGKQETVSLKKFLGKLKSSGLREDDPRLSGLFSTCQRLNLNASCSRGLPKDQDVELDRQGFGDCVRGYTGLVKKALNNEFVIADFSDFSSRLDHIFHNCKANNNGVIPSMLPQLARHGPDSLGVSFCSGDGQRYAQGDINTPFSLQALCRPFSYALAVKDIGAETVHQFVGLEHHTDAYEEILVDRKGQPHNPMMDSGGVMVSSLLKYNMPSADRFEYIFNEFKKMSGNEYLLFNNSVYLSERECADRESIISHYMMGKKCFPAAATLQDSLDLYFQMSAIDASCESGSVLAATLANGGICPLTGERLLDSNTVRYTLSLMHSCGMNNYSGHFAFYVGLPCKSSMSGALLVVVPDVGGFCVWSPPLDMFDNSVRGIQFSRDLVNEFNFHKYDHQLSNMSLDADIREDVIALFAAHNGDLQTLSNLNLKGHNQDFLDTFEKRSLLHVAAANGHLDTCKFLVEKCGLSHTCKDSFDRTPLDEAARFKHGKVVNFLESKQACGTC